MREPSVAFLLGREKSREPIWRKESMKVLGLWRCASNRAFSEADAANEHVHNREGVNHNLIVSSSERKIDKDVLPTIVSPFLRIGVRVWSEAG